MLGLRLSHSFITSPNLKLAVLQWWVNSTQSFHHITSWASGWPSSLCELNNQPPPHTHPKANMETVLPPPKHPYSSYIPFPHWSWLHWCESQMTTGMLVTVCWAVDIFLLKFLVSHFCSFFLNLCLTFLIPSPSGKCSFSSQVLLISVFLPFLFSLSLSLCSNFFNFHSVLKLYSILLIVLLIFFSLKPQVIKLLVISSLFFLSV